jgi:hypothetical protein
VKNSQKQEEFGQFTDKTVHGIMTTQLVVVFYLVLLGFMFPILRYKLVVFLKKKTRINKMTAEQFTYWLQGFFELSGATTLNEEQVKILKEHLGLVVKKVTPSTLPSNTITIYGGNGFDAAKPLGTVKDWTTITADNKVMDIKTELTC